MAIPWNAVLAARSETANHVQCEVVALNRPVLLPGAVEAQLRIVRVFRGSLTPGTLLRVCLHAIESQGEVPDGDFYYDWSMLRGARYMELFVDERLSLPFNSCSGIIEAPTVAPVLEQGIEAQPPEKRSFLGRLFAWLARKQ